MVRYLAPFAAVVVALAATATMSAQPDPTLAEGWNLVGSTGETVEEFVDARNEANECDVLAIWRFEADQTWDAWFSNAPELDEIEQLGGQSGYWVFCG